MLETHKYHHMKKLIFTLLLCGFIISCTQKETTTEKPATTQNPNEALIKQYYAYFNAHEWTKMAEMYADTADFKDPSFGTEVVKQTHQQTAQKYAELNKIFPNLHDEVVATYPSGEKHITVEFISTGTANDGSKFVLPICTIFTIENGKITKDFTYYDNFQE